MKMQKRREHQRWVSHNKVLIGSGDGGSKKPHARNPNFDSEETKLLIQLWGDPQVQRTLITIHKKHPVIAKIAEKMRAYGYSRSTEEINTRIKNLKCLYNRIKKDLDSGLLNEPSWKHFHAMDEILSRPVFGNNKAPVTNKIIISPSSATTTPPPSDHTGSLVQVKEEDISEDESMDFEGSELRPEDLLSVIETEHADDQVDVKEEPMDSTEDKTKLKDKLDADSSSDLIRSDTDRIKIKDSMKTPLVNENIINYQNDSLSITSVQGNGQQKISTIIPKSCAAQQQSKISLVPTQLLLKPQAVNGFKQPAVSIVTTSGVATITTNAQSSSSIPMKVVFVNALNNNANAQQTTVKQQITLNKSIAQLQTPNSSTFISTNNLLSSNQSKVQLVNQLPSPTFSTSASTVPKVSTTTLNNLNNHHHRESSGKSSKSLLGNKLPVIRNLLTNIVEIENQRLEIEKQRFEYEKKVGNELLSVLKTFIECQSRASDQPNASAD